MDLQIIKTFLMIAKQGSFQGAADELGYAQSTITMQVQKLEESLGVKLFERGKKIHLTGAGNFFKEQVSPIVKNLEQLQSTMADFAHGESGMVRIGVGEPCASFRLPEILAPFIAVYPGIQISIQIGQASDFGNLIRKGELDFAICSVPEIGTGLHFEPLYSEQLVLLVPAGHPLFEKDEVYTQDLEGQRFLGTARNCAYRRKLETTLQEMGKAYSVIEISSLTALKYYVQASYGLAFVPAITVEEPLPGTAVKNVKDLQLELVTGILQSTDCFALNSAGEKVSRFIAERFQN